MSEGPVNRQSAAAELAQLSAAYAALPGQSERLLQAAQRWPLADWPGPLRDQALRLIGWLALEHRNPRAARAPLEQALSAPQSAARDPVMQAQLLCLLARADIQEQAFDRAEHLLDAASQLGVLEADPLTQVMWLGAQGQLSHRRGQMQAADDYAASSLRLAAQILPALPGPWVQGYATRAVALRELGRQDERRQVLEQGVERCAQQRRWSEAANLCSGLFDQAIEAGDLERAEQALQQGDRMVEAELNDGGAPDAPGRAMLQLSRARLLAARGCYAEACVGLRATLAAQSHRLVGYEYVRRLEQLAEWTAEAGDAVEALACLRQAYDRQRDLIQQSLQHDVELQRRRLEREQAQLLLEQQAAHEAALAEQQRQLASSLQRQHELQAELIESSTLATLGRLLIGVASELQQPLAQSAEHLRAAEHETDGLLQLLQGQQVSRSAVQSRLSALERHDGEAESLLQQSIALVAAYRELHDPGALATGFSLEELIRQAWDRVVPAGRPLHLSLQAGALQVHLPGHTLQEVLVELFRNIEQHAYGPEEAGWVEVKACLDQGRLRLSVADGGRGIAPELLPRIFEPYVSSESGAPGLGLFVAAAAVHQGLGGELQARSKPGEGTRVELLIPESAHAR